MISAVDAKRQLTKLVNNQVEQVLIAIDTEIKYAVNVRNSNEIIFHIDDNVSKLVIEEIYVYLIDIGYHTNYSESTDSVKYFTISF
jgi:hypothetical protein